MEISTAVTKLIALYDSSRAEAADSRRLCTQQAVPRLASNPLNRGTIAHRSPASLPVAVDHE